MTWLSPLTVTPAKANEAKSVFDSIYFAANAHVYMDKAAGAPALAYSLAGRLVGGKSGWVVLEVPMALVRGAFDALHEPGVEMPPAFSEYESYKAHISVMRPEEVERAGGLDKITERGHFFNYTLGPVQTVEPHGWDEMSKVWFIKVRSPDLEKLRKSYGMSARPKNNEFDFHITIGVRRKSVLRANDVSKAADDKTADDLAVSSISLTPDATGEVLKAPRESPRFPMQEKEPKQESDLSPLTAAVKLAADLNEKRGVSNVQTQADQPVAEKAEKAKKTKTVAIDLDGTLAHYDGWKGEDVIGDPRPGAKAVVKWLKEQGHTIILWTTRGNIKRLKEWLKKHDIPVDYINENPNQPSGSSEKIIAEIYVDDRAIDARKSWPEIKKELAERLEE
jgi:adenylylsulfate kinase